MSEEYQKLLAEGESKERVVCDYISGMTDQYSLEKFKDIFIPKRWRGPGKEIVEKRNQNVLFG